MQQIEIKDKKGNTHLLQVDSIDAIALEAELSRLKNKARELPKADQIDKLKMAVGMVDLTTLEGSDNEKKIDQLCHKAKLTEYPELNGVAAVCVYPVFISQSKKLLASTNINTACVATGFPAGQIPQKLKLSEVEYCLEQGADEIDMVISRGKFLLGRYQEVFTEIEEVAQLCQGRACLKVILETGELEKLEQVRLASELALLAGGNFIKTSTGKINPAATLEVSYVMMKTLADFYRRSGEKRGFKPAGGIRTSEDALTYLIMAEEILGKDWLDPKLFRFGASSLLDALLKAL